MLPNKNSIDDLEYLANLGFENTTLSTADIEELNAKIKKRVFSYNNGIYFSFISLIVGVFIGISCFFTIHNQPKNYASTTNLVLKDNLVTTKPIIVPTIVLDTIHVEHENFIYPHKRKIQDTTIEKIILNDSISIQYIEPITINTLSDKNIKASKIKHLPNASVIYLHDLKITNYSFLYFKKNEHIRLDHHSGLSSNYANSSATKEDLLLQPNYYLHEVISDAMLFYKKANYNECINSLNTLAHYNKEDINCKFYYGLCYFNKKNYEKALPYFDECIFNLNNTFLQEAQFYTALCLIETNKNEEAKTILKQIVEDGEFYSQKAYTLLKTTH
jgi:hypothetical protein